MIPTCSALTSVTCSSENTLTVPDPALESLWSLLLCSLTPFFHIFLMPSLLVSVFFPRSEVLLALLHVVQDCYRIIEWFALEGTFKDHVVQPLCREQGPLPPAQGAPSPIQPGLEPCHGGGSHSFSGKPGPGPHHPDRDEFLPYIQCNSTLFQFKAIAPCPVTTGPGKKSLSIFLISPFQVLKALGEVYVFQEVVVFQFFELIFSSLGLFHISVKNFQLTVSAKPWLSLVFMSYL